MASLDVEESCMKTWFRMYVDLFCLISLFESTSSKERKRWPWAGRHSAESWRTHYCEDSNDFDKCIDQILKTKSSNPDNFQPTPRHQPVRREGFTVKDEQNMIKYLADNKGDRSGNRLYQDMVSNVRIFPLFAVV